MTSTRTPAAPPATPPLPRPERIGRLLGPLPGGPRYATALVVDALGAGLLRPFLLLYAIGVLHLGASVAGLALSAGMLVGLAAVAPLGRWIDRGARSQVVTATLLTRAAGVGALLAAPGTTGFVLAAALLGTGTQTWPTAHAALVATLVEGRARDTALAAGRSLRNAGLGAGALIATLALAGGAGTLRGLALLTAAGYLLAAALAWSLRVTAPPATPPTTPARRAITRRAGQSPALPGMTVLGLANLPFALCFDVLEVALPVLLVTHLHASPAWSSGIFVGNTALVIIAQVAVVTRLAHRSRRSVLAGSGVLLALSYAGFWLAERLGGVGAPAAVALVAVLYTCGEIGYAGSGTALVVATAPPERLGRALARWELSNGLGRALAPTVLTALLAAGSGLLWGTLAAGTLLGAAVISRRRPGLT
ncbi:MFS transporter [Kitasatospora sp. NBC_01250]|uniref:MFS transporter n=1 Tax=unclassified Kitasatospora TaxID=2633591 RepID=UPI002E12BBD9|nr:MULTISPECIES: MFS transporter [unclassified Kitasatospora]WSJ68547.1 MFS transporter [Kitasatospora sp. NBC_01302]